MTALHHDFLIGTLHLVAGALLLTYSDDVAEFEQQFRIKLKAFFRRRLGNSFLNYELWRVGVSSSFRFRASRIGFRLLGLIFLSYGLAWLLPTFWRYLK
jgi:hypothetical protein